MRVKLAKLAIRAAVRLVALLVGYNISVRSADLPDVQASLEILWPYGFALAGIGLAVDLGTRADRATWRFIAMHDILVLVRNATVVALMFLVVTFFLDRAAALPRSTLFLAWVFDVSLITAALVLRRAFRERALGPALLPYLSRFTREPEKEPMVLVGSIGAADNYMKELRNSDVPYRPSCIISSDPSDVGRELRGVEIQDSLKSSAQFLSRFPPLGKGGAVLFLDDTVSPADLDADVLGGLRARGVRLLRRSKVIDLHGPGGPGLREFNIEELLARAPVNLALDQIRGLISGSRIMVTGAGGSIGSEICRQVAALNCAHLTLVDNSEFLLFTIDRQIGDSFPTLSREAVLCDIRSADLVDRWVHHAQPDIIFHAAALKHVPLMEAHPCESVLTNVLGTRNIVAAAERRHVSHLVFISTDKAVDPSNVMGATKRLAESVVRARQSESRRTRFSVVRFGNVLGSAGSVVPTFSEQIARGGPVTVTHPDVERYFMTIPEAVQLVLHATATSSSRNEARSSLFVLDMGKPVRIMDLAQRMIDLNSREGQPHIKIQITGLRPGEKLTEALIDSTEEATLCESGVFEVTDRVEGAPVDEAVVERLASAARTGDSAQTRVLIFETLAAVRQ